MRSLVLAALPVLVLSGCSNQFPVPPTSTAASPSGLNGAPTSKAPEAANSLPSGAQTNAPLTPAVGNINNTRVGPAVQPRRTQSTTGY